LTDSRVRGKCQRLAEHATKSQPCDILQRCWWMQTHSGLDLEHQGFATFFPRVVNIDFEAVYAELRVM
jgi:phenylalanine-4-hydroxylase